MKRSNVHVSVPETPIFVQACAVEINYVGLGQAPDGQEYRAFILIQALDSPDAGAMIHISLDAAQFLHDAIETVLERQRVIANSAN
jgi:hypothetical protein